MVKRSRKDAYGEGFCQKLTLWPGLIEGAWINKIKMTANFSMTHICQFVELWLLISEFSLEEHAEDEITWKHANDGQYSTVTAYSAQFLGMVHSPMDHTVWKVWAPSKVKFFAWLAIQDRIWTADRLARRGWPNCQLCPLCKREQESGLHLFVKCRFTLRLWNLVNEWAHLEELDTSTWHLEDSLKEWWVNRSSKSTPNRKAMASLTMLLGWTIWNERNARVFRQKSMPPTILLNNIKSEAILWVTAGAKKLGNIIPGE